MGFSGGIWTPPSLPGSWSPAISGQAATPTDWNTLLTAIAGGLSTMICRDGQSTVTADIPFAGFRLKGVGNGVLSTDAANMSQLVSGAGVYAIDTGAADLYAIAPTPAISAYVVGQAFRFKAIHANVTTTPTLAINGLTAGVISWANGTALTAGNIAANGMYDVIVATATPTFHLQTPIPPEVLSTAPTTQNFTSGSAATYTTPAGVKWIKVRMVGAGGGGGGSGGTTGPDGAAGGATIFNAINANGGAAGKGNATGAAVAGGAGGTGGTGTATLRISGQAGGSSLFFSGANTNVGAPGGSTPFFGGGGNMVSGNTSPVTGAAGVANTGGGGGGATSPATTVGSGGGGSGEYVELVIGSPAATYTYTVGASGAGGIGTGTGAATGGAGAAGFITVEEHYND